MYIYIYIYIIYIYIYRKPEGFGATHPFLSPLCRPFLSISLVFKPGRTYPFPSGLRPCRLRI